MRLRVLPARIRKAGYSLIEVVAALVVVSIGVPAVAYMYTSALVGDSDVSARTQGMYLANALMNEISIRRFRESVVYPGNGPETGEVSGYSRANFDDIDDYDQFANSGGWGHVSPPLNEQGVALNDFPGYSQYVSVVNLSPPTDKGVQDLTPVADGTTDIKLVTVIVRWSGGRHQVTVKKIFAAP